MELQSGTYLQNGKYRIERMLGQGGFGITYQATTTAKVSGDLGQMDVEIKVAIKEFFMKENCLRDATTSAVSVPSTGSQAQVAQYRKKFIKEAHNLASLKHTHIVKVTDVFEENNTVYYVMQFLSGGSLQEYIKRQDDGRLPEKEALKYILQVADALRYMHNEKSMCHFDVKPSNILLDGKGNASLIDFGISKSYDASGHQTSSTPVGISKGYAPLEQYQQSLQEFSPLTDIYSLGATLYFILTGNVPPEASVVNEDGLPPKPTYVSDRVWNAIIKAMQPRRKDRPASMEAFIDLLIGSTEDVSDHTDDVTVVNDDEEKHTDAKKESKSKNAPTSKKWITIIAAVVSAAVVTIVVLVFNNRSNSYTTTEKNNQLSDVAGTSSSEVKDRPVISADGIVAYYYTGTMKNGVPDGKGKAIYKDGRVYKGTFVNGQRQDENAVLTMQNGDTFQGSFVEDHFGKGVYRVKSDGSHFEGEFKKDSPYNGTWYDAQGNLYMRVTNGK